MERNTLDILTSYAHGAQKKTKIRQHLKIYHERKLNFQKTH